MDAPLFAKPVPVTVVTGEYKSGKTIFALTTGYPLERVLIYDNELSAETYHTADNPFVRVDLPGEMARQFPKGYTATQLYEAWLKHWRAIPPGKYDVIIVDTVETIEDGLGDWVESHASAFGHTAAQYQKMSGIFWGDVKSEWKRVIQELKSRCQMVILIVHMRDEYKNNVRTGKRQRRGKETLSELATLEVELVRKSDQVAPSAIVHKDRFFSGSLGAPSTIKPNLPRWLEVCTWDIIRGYLVKPTEKDVAPPVIDTSKEDEMEKLRLQAMIAEAEALKAEHQATQAIATATKVTGTSATKMDRRTPDELRKEAATKIKNRLAEIGVNVTKDFPISAALASVDVQWANEIGAAITAQDWGKALTVDMSETPAAKITVPNGKTTEEIAEMAIA